MKPVKQTSETYLTIKRSGQFLVRTIGANHCGTNNLLTMKYTLIAKCKADSLDERGFLFDQLKIDSFLKSQVETPLSCEQYAIHLSRQLFKQIRAENPKCMPELLSLTLSPAPYQAELIFEWIK